MFGQLPSTVRDNATTFDMLVVDALQLWEKEQIDKSQGKPTAPNLSLDEMQAMINNARKT
jgi:hypothetical protein